MKDCGVKKIYKKPDAALIAACGKAVLAASDLLSGFDAEVSDTNWFENNGGND